MLRQQSPNSGGAAGADHEGSSDDDGDSDPSEEAQEDEFAPV